MSTVEEGRLRFLVAGGGEELFWMDGFEDSSRARSLLYSLYSCAMNSELEMHSDQGD